MKIALGIIQASWIDYIRSWLPGGVISLIIVFPGLFLKILTNAGPPFSLAIGLSCCLFAWTLAFTKLGLLEDIHSFNV